MHGNSMELDLNKPFLFVETTVNRQGIKEFFDFLQSLETSVTIRFVCQKYQKFLVFEHIVLNRVWRFINSHL
jgi:hypothetical protein